MRANGIPDSGDVIWISLGPVRGNEQDGYRPVVVLTDADLNELIGRVSIVPITSTIRGWETEVMIGSLPRPGVALIDQIRSVSFTARPFKFRDERATDEEMEAIRYGLKMYLNL
jgi:mRNA interferase MazF